MAKIKDKLWIWGHVAGTHDGGYALKGTSRMTPAEGAFYLGVPNIIMVRANNKPAPPFDQYAISFSPLSRVVWSIVSAGGGTENNEVSQVCDLAARFPNICGVMMDDFFQPPDKEGNIATFSPLQLKTIREGLIVSGRRLDLWVVLYSDQFNQLDMPVRSHLEQCDVIAFWTWEAKNLKNLEQNFERVENLFPSCRKVLGCYMYDYGGEKPMPVSLMEKQCQLGLEWLKSGRIEGMIFLASCICDMGLETVEWTRQWIQEVGEREGS